MAFGKGVFDKWSFTKAEIDLILDGTVVCAHQGASDGKGGAKNKRLVGRMAEP